MTAGSPPTITPGRSPKNSIIPSRVFIYINYVGTGGKSMTWDQLAEMRDAGVDIESHTYSHSNLRVPGGGVDAKSKSHDQGRRGGPRDRTAGCGRKSSIRRRCSKTNSGIKVNAIAYPFGIYSKEALEVVKEAGLRSHVHAFMGRRSSAPALRLNCSRRYAVELGSAGSPMIFADAHER